MRDVSRRRAVVRLHFGLSRVCGDVSCFWCVPVRKSLLSPRMRDVSQLIEARARQGLPRVCGMFPSANYPKRADLGFPRVWGCFRP